MTSATKTPVRRRKKPIEPVTMTLRAEKLEQGDFIVGVGEVEQFFMRQLVVVFVKGEPIVWSRQKKVEVVLED